MDSKDFLACLRKTENSPEVVHILSGMGVKKKLKVPKGDTEARVDLEKQGLTMIFLPKGPKDSELVLVAVQFFSEEEEDYSTYKGDLPYKINFTDDQAEVRKKLGSPSRTKDFLARDFWDIDKLVLTVEFGGRDGRITMVSFHAPEYY